jgi:hypothetical protein
MWSMPLRPCEASSRYSVDARWPIPRLLAPVQVSHSQYQTARHGISRTRFALTTSDSWSFPAVASGKELAHPLAPVQRGCPTRGLWNVATVDARAGRWFRWSYGVKGVYSTLGEASGDALWHPSSVGVRPGDLQLYAQAVERIPLPTTPTHRQCSQAHRLRKTRPSVECSDCRCESREMV